MEQVERVLAEIGAAEVPTIVVFNKIDAAGLLPEVGRDPCGNIDRLWVSSRTGEGLEQLRAVLAERAAAARSAGHQDAGQQPRLQHIDGSAPASEPADHQPVVVPKASTGPSGARA
jgi:GTP-binding protein HflX